MLLNLHNQCDIESSIFIHTIYFSLIDDECWMLERIFSAFFRHKLASSSSQLPGSGCRVVEKRKSNERCTWLTLFQIELCSLKPSRLLKWDGNTRNCVQNKKKKKNIQGVSEAVMNQHWLSHQSPLCCMQCHRDHHHRDSVTAANWAAIYIYIIAGEWKWEPSEDRKKVSQPGFSNYITWLKSIRITFFFHSKKLYIIFIAFLCIGNKNFSHRTSESRKPQNKTTQKSPISLSRRRFPSTARSCWIYMRTHLIERQVINMQKEINFFLVHNG